MKSKRFKDVDLEKMGIIAKIENIIYPISPNQIERKVRKVIVLAFNEGYFLDKEINKKEVSNSK